MNSPNAPDDARNWNSIDIFLFSNGQQYSPPRKYHLKSEELKCWDTTLESLARSQFGSMHSNIELYTLDGKKIDAPLQLANCVAYVAVKEPDGFVQAGYEKYLLKASRSREKRQERLNSIETANSANIEFKKEQFKSNLTIPNDVTVSNGKKLDDDISLDTEIEYSATVASNIFTRSQKDTESLQEVQTTNNSLRTEKPEILPLHKPVNLTKNTILKKIYPKLKGKDDKPSLAKKRNTSFSKDIVQPYNNSKRLTISSNDTNVLKTNIDDKVETKEKSQTNINKTIKNNLEDKEKPEIIKKLPLIKNYSSEKDLTVLSDVYKNTESDIQSLFLEADRKTALLNNDHRKVSHTLDNIEEFVEAPKNCIKSNKAISKQSTVYLSERQAPDNINQPGTLNLNLNIDLKGCTVRSDKNSLSACKSYMTLLKPDKASQINVDVNLCSEESIFLQEQSIDSVIPKTCEEIVTENNTKVVIIRCKCNLFKSDNNFLTAQCIKENENYLFLVPNQINNKLIQRGDQLIRRTSDKEIQESLHSCIRVPVTTPLDMTSYRKHENVTKHKVSISQEAPTELNSHKKQLKSQGDMHTILPPNAALPNNFRFAHKIDDYAQTNWSNVLLQAKSNEDGHYTFHFPPLHLLMQYNLL